MTLIAALAALALFAAWLIERDQDRVIYVRASTPVITQLPQAIAIPTAYRKGLGQ